MCIKYDTVGFIGLIATLHLRIYCMPENANILFIVSSDNNQYSTANLNTSVVYSEKCQVFD